MKRKLLSILAIGMLSISFTSCGGQSEEYHGALYNIPSDYIKEESEYGVQYYDPEATTESYALNISVDEGYDIISVYDMFDSRIADLQNPRTIEIDGISATVGTVNSEYSDMKFKRAYVINNELLYCFSLLSYDGEISPDEIQAFDEFVESVKFE